MPKSKSRATTSSTASEDPKNIFSKAWFKSRRQKKNKNQLLRYTTRLTELEKIKNPNDWQKNQIAHSKDQIKKYSDKNLKTSKTSASIRGDQKKNESKTEIKDKKVNNKEVKNKKVVNNNNKKVNQNNKEVKSNNNKEVTKEKPKYKQVSQEELDKKIKQMSKPKEKPDPLKDYRRGEGTKLGKDTRITKRLKKAGWTEDRLAAKRKAHAEWKANRKNRKTLKKNTMGG